MTIFLWYKVNCLWTSSICLLVASLDLNLLSGSVTDSSKGKVVNLPHSGVPHSHFDAQ